MDVSLRGLICSSPRPSVLRVHPSNATRLMPLTSRWDSFPSDYVQKFAVPRHLSSVTAGHRRTVHIPLWTIGDSLIENLTNVFLAISTCGVRIRIKIPCPTPRSPIPIHQGID